MDFRVVINSGNPDVDVDIVFEQYAHALDLVDRQMAYWNNFCPELEFNVTITKVPSETDTIGVSVDESLKLSDHIS